MGTQLPSKAAQPPIFGPCPLWPNCWMYQDATWYRVVDLGPGHIVLDGDLAPHSRKRHSRPPLFGPCLPNGRPFQLLLSSFFNFLGDKQETSMHHAVHKSAVSTSKASSNRRLSLQQTTDLVLHYHINNGSCPVHEHQQQLTSLCTLQIS